MNFFESQLKVWAPQFFLLCTKLLLICKQTFLCCRWNWRCCGVYRASRSFESLVVRHEPTSSQSLSEGALPVSLLIKAFRIYRTSVYRHFLMCFPDERSQRISWKCQRPWRCFVSHEYVIVPNKLKCSQFRANVDFSLLNNYYSRPIRRFRFRGQEGACNDGSKSFSSWGWKHVLILCLTDTR